jgi:hypothetical protein
MLCSENNRMNILWYTHVKDISHHLFYELAQVIDIQVTFPDFDLLQLDDETDKSKTFWLLKRILFVWFDMIHLFKINFEHRMNVHHTYQLYRIVLSVYIRIENLSVLTLEEKKTTNTPFKNLNIYLLFLLT